ncbi:beta-flanking protein [Hirsutella rhossiliensis]|uniref:Beta-flanking protein n=1 Tax=Hirsutella rhossiliensis TaxID=111463 RepID=A0A9P8SHP7_9HYPO|nr:beta-flanking protein [Hirsutella rhossiliensis]KAH0962374.1 beta-flanking protein [Hirsutella rhossiliensis]
MDKLINAGKEFLENQTQGSNQGQEAHDRRDDDDELKNADHEASRLAGSSGSTDLFSKVVGALGQRKGQIANEDIDEEDVARKHKQAYDDDSHGDENSLGAAAAMQALKMFGKGGSDSGSSSNKESQGGQGAFLAMAMSEASKLFDVKAAQGKVPEGASKESTIQKAGEMAMKMYFKNQAKQQGGLMGMASQFMK